VLCPHTSVFQLPFLHTVPVSSAGPLHKNNKCCNSKHHDYYDNHKEYAYCPALMRRMTL
jgi:hypothetical protein